MVQSLISWLLRVVSYGEVLFLRLLRVMSYGALTSLLAAHSDVLWSSFSFLGCSEGCHMMQSLVSWLLKVVLFGAVTSFLSVQSDAIWCSH